MIATTDDLEDFEEFFQNEDQCDAWKQDPPAFEWTEEDLEEFRLEELAERQYWIALAGWWEIEGVRCATFGRDPSRNPYLEMIKP